MCTILLSIHPEFVEKIISGEKRFEFRRVIAKRKPDKILIYSTSPICKIIGEAEIETIITGKPENVWSETKKFSGVKKEYYVEYFMNKEVAFAYKLKNVKEYSVPKSLDEIGVKIAPQSFIYI